MIVVATALALLGAAVTTGLAQEAFASDATGLVWMVTAITLLGTFAAFEAPSWLTWICDHGLTLLFGLLGTVVGFMAALHGIVSGDEVAKLAGVATALSTTAVGMVSHLYLILLERVSRP
jgi:hypothetical protein